MVTMGSHQTSFLGKYTPAQNINAYAALKFHGMSPGQRLNANKSISTMGNISFAFTSKDDSPMARNDKPPGACSRIRPGNHAAQSESEANGKNDHRRTGEEA
jgi:hypothetical protein